MLPKYGTAKYSFYFSYAISNTLGLTLICMLVSVSINSPLNGRVYFNAEKNTF